MPAHADGLNRALLEICTIPLGRTCRSGRKVTLFEESYGCGGHTLTDDSPGYPVDLGFQVLVGLMLPDNHLSTLLCLAQQIVALIKWHCWPWHAQWPRLHSAILLLIQF